MVFKNEISFFKILILIIQKVAGLQTLYWQGLERVEKNLTFFKIKVSFILKSKVL